MSMVPSLSQDIVLEGNFSFTAKSDNGIELTDNYKLKIIVPGTFPKNPPRVIETGGRIPRTAEYHVYPQDNTLCMGSPLRLIDLLSKKPNLVGFAESCLVPYLYAMTGKLLHGKDFIFGELAHDEQGILDDYVDLFRLQSHQQVIEAMELLGMKRRIANKKQCPCGCGLRLGVCHLHVRLNQFRSLFARSHFKSQAEKLRKGLKKSTLKES